MRCQQHYSLGIFDSATFASKMVGESKEHASSGLAKVALAGIHLFARDLLMKLLIFNICILYSLILRKGDCEIGNPSLT